jgi:hypothetical protein
MLVEVSNGKISGRWKSSSKPLGSSVDMELEFLEPLEWNRNVQSGAGIVPSCTVDERGVTTVCARVVSRDGATFCIAVGDGIALIDIANAPAASPEVISFRTSAIDMYDSNY